MKYKKKSVNSAWSEAKERSAVRALEILELPQMSPPHSSEIIWHNCVPTTRGEQMSLVNEASMTQLADGDAEDP